MRSSGAVIEVHRILGPGLLESAYETCLCYELNQRRGVVPESSQAAGHLQGNGVECDFRIDILLPGLVIVELKAVGEIVPIHEAQLLTYMKLAKISTGLLINFNVPLLKNGIKRRKL